MYRSGRATPTSRPSFPDLKRPASARGYRPQSPMISSSRPSSSMGSRPSTPTFRPEPYTGSISVSIRPNPHTSSAGSNQVWQIEEYSNTITNAQDNSSYTFDNVFGPSLDVSNRTVYNRSCAHLVNKFLHEGYNSTLFAYGMTGSGKTYSMRGDDHDPGFVRLAIDDIFTKIDSPNSGCSYALSVTYLEIYNEKIVDLLANGGTAMGSHAELKIRDDPDYGVKIMGVCSPTVSSKQSLLQLIKAGDMKRKTSATDYNARSSRSHAILQLRLHTVDMAMNTEHKATLSLCDLAGSERATSCAERRKEGSFINKSLLALSTVINKLSLASTSGSMDHIPYRDSKLTRLLQPSLSGSALISILCNVHLGSGQSALTQQFVTETTNTLRFAARAKDIVLSVKASHKSSIGDAEAQRLIDDLRRQVESQKNELTLLKLHSNMQPVGSEPSSDSSVAQLQGEIKVLNERIEHLNRLSDLNKTEVVLLRNDALNDILGMDIDKTSQQMMMANLEDFYKRLTHEMEQYKQYNATLENQLRAAHQQLAAVAMSENNKAERLSDKRYDSIVRSQEEEIQSLKETLRDKDHIIQGLTKTTKLRRLVDSSNSNAVPSVDYIKRPTVPQAVESPDKENVVSEIRQFRLSPKKPTLPRFN
ncbi:uncharacterized protein CXQ87_004441 [Candidozyma duobushaemuli]|uniref:Kinesin-like protein n=2 Tax=Candidozyma TaxID=3303203 RepID=A0ABX8I9B7_9ASCO|nr:uncharacterized protein CXQ87_004441 [[Candida] duobushaemulonis]PVH16884.1 hypothetical protein CXQ87_004441 [[Candida] duobushaemulonis]QWU89672.1 hypothetical protein CA3LBN_004020 [[Candida] haemuloni]